MRLVLSGRGREPADVELIADEEATVGDLLEAVAEDGHMSGLVIDGRYCHADLALAEIGLYEGAELTPAGRPGDGPPPRPTGLELRTVAGLDAGRRLPLIPAGIEVGRDPECELVLGDEGVSRRHLRVTPGAGGLRASLSDEGSVNGTWVEGRRITAPTELAPGEIFEAGDVALSVVPVPRRLGIDPLRQVRRDGTIPFNRPPRPRLPDTQPALGAPEKPRDPERPRLSIVSAIGPLVLGLVLVIALHNILFALFMLLSPILVIGGWLENRRFAKRTAQGNTREQAARLAEFEQQVAEQRTEQLVRLRAGLPDPAEVISRAVGPDPRLWERRPGHPDFLTLMGGLGEVPFRPGLAQRYPPSEGAEEVLARHARIELAPIAVALDQGGVVGVVGPRAAALGVARSLVCQAAVLHGPADLRIAVFTDEAAIEDWEWAKWLPHARDPGSGGSRRLLAAGPGPSGTLAAELVDGAGEERRALVVLDSPALIEGRGAAGRALLRRAELVSGVVVASTPERLPASCTTVIELAPEGAESTLRRPQAGETAEAVLAAGIGLERARECALALARFEDADLELGSGALPDRVALLGLLGLRDAGPEELLARWQRSAGQTGLDATFALAQNGPFGVDLVADGPHGLIAGTTGAGKSELLRSLVAALASAHGPDRLNFVLIDYKGGSAFAECAELPHTVGLVTDLDEQLGERALQSLEAELRYRERVLRDHGAADLIEYAQRVADGGASALPRLMVIIDEFATLASELPDFVAALIGIAQRGRSLGVHLLLATQRPSGAVSENIRANTNIRICLRVNTPQESSDVIDAPAAAQIGRSQPGRAQVRLGPGELEPIQTALVSTITPPDASAGVQLRRFGFAAAVAGQTVSSAAVGADSDLQRLVNAGLDAYGDRPAPRRPWLPPLPPAVSLEALRELGPPRPLAGEPGLIATLGLADDPAAQRQYPIGWNLDAGNLLMYGIGGSGTTTALGTLALALAERLAADRLHLYVIDFGAGELSALEPLPAVGAVIAGAEHERQRRLLKRLSDELRGRRGLDARAREVLPRIVLLIDGFAGFQAEHSDLAGERAREELARIWADGTDLGVHVVITADRLGAVPLAFASLAQQRLALQLSEAADYAQFGLPRRAVPSFSPGRAIAAGSAQILQIARAQLGLETRVGELTGGARAARGPAPVGVLPSQVALAPLLGADRGGDEPWFLPIAIGDEELAPVGFELYEGDHALISGSPRTGRTTTLLVAARVAAALHPEAERYAIALRRSALRELEGLSGLATTADELEALIETLRLGGRAGGPRRLVLIDDADAIDDPRRALTDLLGAPVAGLHALVAGRSETFRALGHWTAGVRRSRTGLLLVPDLQLDGQLLGATLPRRPAPPARPGCGYRVDSAGIELVQVATLDGAD
jgi:S-DNA-T family DNA segregation ATPase FtsK/SpoIIIE